jgi:pimeloyl-ACP methyl ester carboxylesterase
MEPHRTVYAMDRRGRGDSGDTQAYALEREWEDIAAVVDTIGGSVEVVAHSFGASCALNACRLTPHVRRLVLYEPPMPFGRRFWSDESSAMAKVFFDAGEQEQVLLMFYRDILRMPEHHIAARQKETPLWAAKIAAAHTIPRELQALDGYLFAPERFVDMRTPTLFLIGSESPPFRRSVADILCAALPDSRIVVLPGQGHSAIRDAPDLFVREVLAFLS